MTICYLFWYFLFPFGTFSHFGLLYQEKSGNPPSDLVRIERPVPKTKAPFPNLQRQKGVPFNL
jgi:hypothetical protein